MHKYNSVVVCGPTACGKTSLGVDLADRMNGVIFSADSRQIYRGMDIGTGKDLAEYEREGRHIPYRLLDIAEPGEIYTLYRYLCDFNAAFNETLSSGMMPVIVGGTGLYVEAAVKQYDVPHAPEDPALRDELMAEEKDVLEARLSALSPELYSRTDLSSKKRIVRAVEIALSPPDKSDLPVRESLNESIRPLVIGIAPVRQVILDRIDRRLEQRLANGMIEEVETLMRGGISRERLLMFGMEYKYIALYLYGDISREEMVEQLRVSIHRLSKRQMTWFRGMERRGIPMRWYDSFDCAEDIAEYMSGN